MGSGRITRRPSLATQHIYLTLAARQTISYQLTNVHTAESFTWDTIMPLADNNDVNGRLARIETVCSNSHETLCELRDMFKEHVKEDRDVFAELNKQNKDQDTKQADIAGRVAVVETDTSWLKKAFWKIVIGTLAGGGAIGGLVMHKPEAQAAAETKK